MRWLPTPALNSSDAPLQRDRQFDSALAVGERSDKGEARGSRLHAIADTTIGFQDDPTGKRCQGPGHFGVAVARSNAVDIAMTRLTEERFDQVIVDFDDPKQPRSCSPHAQLIGREQPSRNRGLAARARSNAFHPRRGRSFHPHETRVSCGRRKITFARLSLVLLHDASAGNRCAVEHSGGVFFAPSADSAITKRCRRRHHTRPQHRGMEVLAAKPLPRGLALHISFQLPGSGLHQRAPPKLPDGPERPNRPAPS